MKTIDLGKIKVPLDYYASQGNAALGIRGSGKTYTGTAIAEQLLDAGVPITVLDPIGIWRFLRVPKKEGGKAYQVVVAGGEHGDLPLPVRGAGDIMRAAMRDGVSIVFDLYSMELSKRDWRDIVTAVVKTMLYENKACGLRHVFIEEAAEFVPQKVTQDTGVVYGMCERLVRMGGNAQLGVTLINQRAEEMNKAVLELCDLLILHRQKGRRSLDNLSKWLDVAAVDTAADVGKAVPALENGECFIWPAGTDRPTRTRIPPKHTFHPDRTAMKQAVIAEARRVDVGAFASALKERLKNVVAEAEANDPVKLRAENARLRAELTKKGPTAPDKNALNQEYTQGRADGFDAGRLKGRQELAPSVVAAHKAAMDLGERAMALVELMRKATELPPISPSTPQPVAPRGPTQALQRPPRSQGNGTLPAGEQRTLLAVAQHGEASREQLTVLTGYKRSSRDSFIARLAGKGLVRFYGEGMIAATPEGLSALGSAYEPLPTGDALREYWLARLPEGERRVLAVAVEYHPGTVTREQISEQTNYKRSSRDSFISRLAARRLIVAGRDGITAAALLFG